LNVVGFIIAILFNGLSAELMPFSLPEITNEWDPRIAPAGYAFAIWGLIYSLLGTFVFYQALPGDIAPERNDALIFENITYHFFINMLINSVCLVLFQTNTVWGFAISLIDIIARLTSNIFMMMNSTSTGINVTEWISMRGGFSIYSGWVTAATILNVTYFLKFLGLTDPDIPFGMDEESVTVVILWVAFAIYNLKAYWDRNPLYDSVFIWVILAIRNKIVNNKAHYTSISDSATYIAIIHGISMVALWSWLATESYYDIDLTNIDIGIFYKE
jgi:benzodiazapine receptor